MVRLMAGVAVPVPPLAIFQFQYGAINGTALGAVSSNYTNFNSNMVRLMVAAVPVVF